MHNPECVLKKEIHEVHCDFEIKTNHLISTKRPDLAIIGKKKKENMPNSGLCWPQNRFKRKLKERWISRSCLRTKKTIEHEGDGGTSCNCCTWNNPERLDKETGWLGNERTSGDYPDFSIIKIGKSSGDTRRLAITQIPVRNAGVKKLSNNNNNNANNNKSLE